MKKLLLLLCLALMAVSASAVLPKTLIGMDIGISNKNIPVNIDLLYNKFQIGFGFELLYNKGTEGNAYPEIDERAWVGFSEMFINETGTYYCPINFQFGYNIYKNLIIGIGVGFSKETEYINVSDYYIFSTGKYVKTHITRENGMKTQLKFFASYLIPFNINNRSFLKVNAQYCSLTKAGVGIGIGFIL